MLKSFISALLFVSFALISHKTCQADVVVNASGANTFTTFEFFEISADELPFGLTISQIAIDLQGGTDPNDFWDSDQPSASGWGFRNGIGLVAGDVTFSPAVGTPGPHGSVLTIDFLPGSFATGDSFTFDMDTDFTITDGDEFGAFGVTVSMLLSDGSNYNTVFVNDGVANQFSEARFVLSVPEPAHVGFSALFLIPLMTRRRRNK